MVKCRSVAVKENSERFKRLFQVASIASHLNRLKSQRRTSQLARTKLVSLESQ